MAHKPKPNADILLDFTGRNGHFIWNLSPNPDTRARGKILYYGFPRDLEEKQGIELGLYSTPPRPVNPKEWSEAKPLVFDEDMVKPVPKGDLSFTRNILMAFPTEIDTLSPGFKKTPLFHILEPLLRENETLKTHIKNQSETMIKLKDLTMQFAGGEMTQTEVIKKSETIAKWLQQMAEQSKNVSRDKEKDKEKEDK